MSYNYLFKILLLGDKKVGKTNFLTRLTENNIFNEKYEKTIGIKYDYKKIIINDIILKLQIWELCSNYEFYTKTNIYIKNTTIIFLIFDLNNKKSFDNIEYWLKEKIYFYYYPEDILIFLIGNKSDLLHKVSLTEINQLLNKYHKIIYREVSCKKNENIIKCYNDACQIILKNINNISDYYKNGIKINYNYYHTKKEAINPENENCQLLFCSIL